MSVPTRRAPPPPSRADHVQVAKAIYGYTACKPDEISFKEGDMVYIIDKSDTDGWWKARVGDNTGFIPSNYVADRIETLVNPLHEAAKRGNIDLLKECLMNKVSVNGFDKSGSTALHWAAHGGHTDCVRVLLNSPRISINVQNKLGDTALHNAAWKKYPEVVELLLAKGASKTLKNNENKTPFDLAQHRHPDVAKLLQDKKTCNGNYGENDDEDSDDD